MFLSNPYWIITGCNIMTPFFACRGWRIAYNSLLNLHAKTGSAEQAEEVYQAMLLNGPCPDSNSANTTIAAFAVVWSMHHIPRALMSYDHHKEPTLFYGLLRQNEWALRCGRGKAVINEL